MITQVTINYRINSCEDEYDNNIWKEIFNTALRLEVCRDNLCHVRHFDMKCLDVQVAISIRSLLSKIIIRRCLHASLIRFSSCEIGHGWYSDIIGSCTATPVLNKTSRVKYVILNTNLGSYDSVLSWRNPQNVSDKKPCIQFQRIWNNIGEGNESPVLQQLMHRKGGAIPVIENSF